MPFKRKFKKRRIYKRKFKRSFKRPKGRKLALYSSPKTPFPKVMRTTLTYAQPLTITQDTAGVAKTWSFVANSIYDPDATGTGHQPRYYDTFLGANGSSAPYNRYRVFGSKISIVAYAPSNTANTALGLISLGSRPAAATTPATILEMQERSNYKTTPIAGFNSKGTARLSSYCRIASVLGMKNLEDSDDTHGVYNGNPNQLVYWDVSICDIIGTGSITQYVMVKIIYYVQLYVLNDVADS